MMCTCGHPRDDHGQVPNVGPCYFHETAGDASAVVSLWCECQEYEEVEP